MKDKILILGGVGNGTVIAAALVDAVLKGNDNFEFCGYLNDRIPVGSLLEGYPVLGNLKETSDLVRSGFKFINTIYKIGGQKERIDLFQNLEIPEKSLFTFVHPLAYTAPGIKLGAGTVIMPNVSISPGVKIGRCCLVMAGATIGHNDTIADYCHIAAQACLGSFVELGTGVHVGLNATIRENIKLGEFSTLGMGSVLLKNVGSNEIWAGNPARQLRKI